MKHRILLAMVVLLMPWGALAVEDDEDADTATEAVAKPKTAAPAKVKTESKADTKADTKPEAKKTTPPAPIVCPPTITVSAQELTKKPEGWHYFSDDDVKPQLDTINVYTQKKTMVKLDPGKGTETFTEWRFPDNGKEKYFIVCSYTRTAVLLKQQLDERLKSCRLSFEPAAGKPDAPQLLHKITCG